MLDSLSLLGLSFFSNLHPVLKYFQLIKASRVQRLGVLIKDSKQPLQVKGVMKISLLLFNLFLYVHWLACLLNYIVLENAPEFFEI